VSLSLLVVSLSPLVVSLSLASFYGLTKFAIARYCAG
jgi:hypothetical protein